MDVNCFWRRSWRALVLVEVATTRQLGRQFDALTANDHSSPTAVHRSIAPASSLHSIIIHI